MGSLLIPLREFSCVKGDGFDFLAVGIIIHPELEGGTPGDFDLKMDSCHTPLLEHTCRIRSI